MLWTPEDPLMNDGASSEAPDRRDHIKAGYINRQNDRQLLRISGLASDQRRSMSRQVPDLYISGWFSNTCRVLMSIGLFSDQRRLIV
jgi:hypothetical protein